MEFVDADVDPELPTVHAVADWLAEQRIGQVTAVTPQPLLVDIEAADLVVDLDIHPLVREAIDDSPLRDGAIRVHLDAGLIRLGGDIGRLITQAVFEPCMYSIPRWTVLLTGLGSIQAIRFGRFAAT